MPLVLESPVDFDGLNGLVKTRRVSEAQLPKIKALEAACRQQDSLPQDLYIEPESALSEGHTNLLFYYVGGELVGMISLSGGTDVEAQATVHPGYRRQGIGRKLLEAARAETRLRGANSLLIVCDSASLSGTAFAQAVGAEYSFSEFLLQFDPTADIKPGAVPQDQISLRQVGADEKDLLIRQNALANEAPEESMENRIIAWLAEPNQRFYVGQRENGDSVGMLRVADEGSLYIGTFSVLPELRGRGYGRQMLTYALRLLEGEGKSIQLEVETQNRNALSLYLSCGFKEVTEYRYYTLGA
jgi:ribosomal protein S18 acetylase RimI-like enzyme